MKSVYELERLRNKFMKDHKEYFPLKMEKPRADKESLKEQRTFRVIYD